MINIINTINLNQQNVESQDKEHVIDGQHRGLPMWLQRSFAIATLLVLSPVFIIVMVCILLESRGNCFYSQQRVGRFGRRFNMLKFRSMYVTGDPRYKAPDPSKSDRDGVCKKYKNDPRITKVGRILRKFSLDELPQLLNIVKGDMAFVGPRPALVAEVEEYPDIALQRLYGVPGLSGLWQVSGRADTDFATQVSLDVKYLARQSIWQDLKILLATVPTVVLAKGAY